MSVVFGSGQTDLDTDYSVAPVRRRKVFLGRHKITEIKPRFRLSRCGSCVNCKTEKCGVCKFCVDNKGPKKLRQACKQNRCLMMQSMRNRGFASNRNNSAQRMQRARQGQNKRQQQQQYQWQGYAAAPRPRLHIQRSSPYPTSRPQPYCQPPYSPTGYAPQHQAFATPQQAYSTQAHLPFSSGANGVAGPLQGVQRIASSYSVQPVGGVYYAMMPFQSGYPQPEQVITPDNPVGYPLQGQMPQHLTQHMPQHIQQQMTHQRSQQIPQHMPQHIQQHLFPQHHLQQQLQQQMQRQMQQQMQMAPQQMASHQMAPQKAVPRPQTQQQIQQMPQHLPQRVPQQMLQNAAQQLPQQSQYAQPRTQGQTPNIRAPAGHDGYLIDQQQQQQQAGAGPELTLTVGQPEGKTPSSFKNGDMIHRGNVTKNNPTMSSFNNGDMIAHRGMVTPTNLSMSSVSSNFSSIGNMNQGMLNNNPIRNDGILRCISLGSHASDANYRAFVNRGTELGDYENGNLQGNFLESSSDFEPGRVVDTMDPNNRMLPVWRGNPSASSTPEEDVGMLDYNVGSNAGGNRIERKASFSSNVLF